MSLMVSLKGPFSLHPDEIMDDKECHRSLSIRGVPFWTSAIYINIRSITCTGHQIYRQSTNTVCHQLFRFISLAWFWFKNWDFYIKIIMQMKHIWDAMGGYIPVFRHLYPQGNMGGWLTIPLLCLSGYQFFDERVKFAGFCHVLHMLW